MYSIFLFLVIIISVLVILVVLMQAPKGGGLAGTFGGVGEMGTMFGVRRTADFLSKATWYLGGALAILCILINLAFLPDSSSRKLQENIQNQQNTQTVPQRQAPQQQR